jgi:magnesium transporter
MPISFAVTFGTGAGSRELEPVAPEAVSDLLPDKGRVVWLDMVDPVDADIELLREEFGLHHLTAEDLIRRGQRPKLEHYDHYSFAVFYALGAERRDELGMLIGDNYLVTVHQGPFPEIAETVSRWGQAATGIEHGVGAAVYTLIDTIVDGYFPLIDEIAERVDAVEDGIFAPRSLDYVPQVLALKRELLELRRTIAPEREVLNSLIRRDQPLLGESTLVYFQDVYDHVIRVLDAVDLYRDQLTALLEAHLSVVSNRLNYVMKRMTALATILMSVNLIASNYGMNFDNIPELHWQNGYFFTLGLMVAVGLALLAIFKRIDWL